VAAITTGLHNQRRVALQRDARAYVEVVSKSLPVRVRETIFDPFRRFSVFIALNGHSAA